MYPYNMAVTKGGINISTFELFMFALLCACIVIAPVFGGNINMGQMQ